MSKWSLLPHRWRVKKEAARHAAAIADILDTAPIRPKNDGLVIFSMIGTAVLLPYLVAVKSFWSQLERGRIVLLDDGTLTAQDKAILAHHCGDPEIIAIGSVQMGPFPSGGCWERFLTILDRRVSEYWIQLDSDTVTIGAAPEIAAAIDRNRSFALLGGEEAEVGVLSVADVPAAFYPGGPAQGHVQARIESRLDQCPAEREWRYLRGCAGFAGFAAMGEGRALAAAFLRQMTALIGEDDVSIWGTEQVASNFQLANERDPLLLPYGRYLNYWAKDWAEEAAFVHFIGTHRYHNGAYERASRIALDRLLA